MLTSEISTTINPAMKSSQWWLVLKQPLLLTEGAELGSASLPAPGSRPEHLPPPQRCHWGFYLHHWLKPCSQPYTPNSKKRALFSVHIFSYPYGIDLVTTVEEKKHIDFWVKSYNNEFQLFQVFYWPNIYWIKCWSKWTRFRSQKSC